MIQPCPGRPELANSLEVQGGMPVVRLQEIEVLARRLLDRFREPAIAVPEARGGTMHLQIRELALGLLRLDFINQEIQSPSLRIRFDLRVPRIPMAF